MMPPVRLGLVYAPTGLRRFVALCGMSRTRELFLTAAPVPAERALGWGLVDRVVAKDDVLATALALGTEMARGAPLAIAGHAAPPGAAAAAARRRRRRPRSRRLVQAAWASEDARGGQGRLPRQAEAAVHGALKQAARARIGEPRAAPPRSAKKA